MKMAYIIALTLCASVRVCFSQENLIINGSFEELDSCPNQVNGNMLNYIANWIDFYSLSSVDVFNNCFFQSTFSMPENFAGNQVSIEGNGHVGFMACGGIPNFNFALEAPVGFINNPLTKDSIYHVSAYFSLAEISGFAVRNLGFRFLSSIYHPEFSAYDTIQADYFTSNYITSKDSWINISYLHVASGLENNLLVGLFTPFNLSDRIAVAGGSPDWCYYYLDNVIVRKATPDEINAVRENRLELSIGPNPTTGPLTIEAKARLQSAWVTDMQGRRLQATHGNGTRWQTDMSGLATGVYFVEAVAEDGRRAVQKIVVMNN